MLPYTPVHHLLFEQHEFPEILVMTSGNLSSEPIFFKDDEAADGLTGIADAFLYNNREIYIRMDDSVTRVFNNKEYIIRRSRGYVPKPFNIDVHKLLQIDTSVEIPSVLACGGELKNVFCMNKNTQFYLSHHIGDLENENTNNAFTSGIEHFKRLFDIVPVYIAYDLHPDYFSSRYALSLPENNKIAVQHHKAHIASCMAENGLSGKVIGVSFDGTGYGEDGNIWGGEFFEGDYYGFERKGHLEYIMMPGGDSAVKHPWRMAVSCLYSLSKSQKKDVRDILENNGNLLNNIDCGSIDFTVKMLEKKLNCPSTSSMGRFFDAISALLGIKTDISYEGQAAIELEYYSKDAVTEPYDIEISKDEASAFIVEIKSVVNQVIRDIQAGYRIEYISSRFHATIAEMVLQGCINIRDDSGLNRVVLSGGVFQNVTLLKMCLDMLNKYGFIVYAHSEIPANDGGIAIGQAMIALAELFSRDDL
jgi:hydrogenase maturation protein HypF